MRWARCARRFADAYVQASYKLDAVIAVDGSTALSMLREPGLLAPGAAAAWQKRRQTLRHPSRARALTRLYNEPGEQLDREGSASRLRLDAARLLCEQIALADVVLLSKLDLVPEVERRQSTPTWPASTLRHRWRQATAERPSCRKCLTLAPSR